MIKRVVEVRPLAGYRLFIRFDDDVRGEVDVASFVRFDGVSEPLRDPARFADAFVDLGTVCWPNDLDLAPEVLYEKVSGRPLSVQLAAASAYVGEPTLRKLLISEYGLTLGSAELEDIVRAWRAMQRSSA